MTRIGHKAMKVKQTFSDEAVEKILTAKKCINTKLKKKRSNTWLNLLKLK